MLDVPNQTGNSYSHRRSSEYRYSRTIQFTLHLEVTDGSFSASWQYDHTSSQWQELKNSLALGKPECGSIHANFLCVMSRAKQAFELMQTSKSLNLTLYSTTWILNAIGMYLHYSHIYIEYYFSCWVSALLHLPGKKG